jgi:hypothetical protein
MALPIIPLATFVIKDKSLPNGKITIKPFTVGQASILLQVKESKDQEEILHAVKQVISECVVEPELDIEKLPVFILEFIFIKIRERSIGEIIDLSFRCTNKVIKDEAEKECGGAIDFKIDLRNINVTYPEGSKNIFYVSDTIGVELFYPSINSSRGIDSEIDIIPMISRHIKTIFNGDEVWSREDCTSEEIDDFVSQIPLLVKNEIIELFFGKMPSVKHEHTQKCPSCGTIHNIAIEGLNDFFG